MGGGDEGWSPVVSPSCMSDPLPFFPITPSSPMKSSVSSTSWYLSQRQRTAAAPAGGSALHARETDVLAVLIR